MSSFFESLAEWVYGLHQSKDSGLRAGVLQTNAQIVVQAVNPQTAQRIALMPHYCHSQEHPNLPVDQQNVCCYIASSLLHGILHLFSGVFPVRPDRFLPFQARPSRIMATHTRLSCTWTSFPAQQTWPTLTHEQALEAWST